MVSTWAASRNKSASPPVPRRILPATQTPEGEVSSAVGFSPQELIRNAIRRCAVEAVIWGMPVVGFDLMYQEMVRKAKGGGFNSILWWPKLPDWKNQTLTPEPDAIYLMAFLNTKSGPLVLEIPPAASLSGSIMNRWQAAIADIGPGGVDKGEGGKYLVLPPSHDRGRSRGHDWGKRAAGMIATFSDSYLGYAVIRIVPASAAAADVERAVAQARAIRLYPLSRAEDPPAAAFVDASDVIFDATLRYDLGFYESVHRMVTAEPWLERDRAMIEPLKTIGIERGKPFAPDDETKAVLDEAMREAKAWLDFHTDRLTPWHEGAHWFAPISQDVARNVTSFWRAPDSYPTGQRAMACSIAFLGGMDVGDAPHSLMTMRDREGHRLEGGRQYRLTIPASVPVSRKWTVTVYDRQTHAFIRNMPWVGRSNAGLSPNPDGSVDIWLGAAAPAGREANWIPADSAGQFEVMARFYGAGKPLMDKSWRLPDIERVS
jgi:hypothetical protein